MNNRPSQLTMSLRRKRTIPRTLRRIRCCVAFVTLLLSPAVGLCAADSPEPHDDGIVEPYVAPKEHLEYIANLDPTLLPTLKGDPEMVEQWQDDRFGVFMHWDPSCQVTGAVSWSRNGRRPHHSSDGTVTKGIDNELYNNLYKTFNPVKFDADQWVRMIKASGAKYFVFTAKHHQGFCMFDSAVTEYDIMSTPFGRDVCKELADACHKHDIKLFFYYSQPDWTERRYYADYPSAEFDWYVDEFLYPQLRELATSYGKLSGIWFDGLGKHPDTWRTPQMLKMLRDIQPHMVFNDRCAPRHWRFGNFDGPENHIGRFQTNRPWETCTKIGGGWGWGGHGPGMSLADCVGLLVRCAGNGGNLLLNTGPAPDGTIKRTYSQEQVERIRRLIGTNHRGHFWRFWMPKEGDEQPWIEVDLGRPETFHEVGITELFGKVRRYELQYLDGKDWKPFYCDRGTIDNLIVHLAEPITAQRVRLLITETNGQLPTIVAFDLFNE